MHFVNYVYDKGRRKKERRQENCVWTRPFSSKGKLGPYSSNSNGIGTWLYWWCVTGERTATVREFV